MSTHHVMSSSAHATQVRPFLHGSYPHWRQPTFCLAVFMSLPLMPLCAHATPLSPLVQPSGPVGQPSPPPVEQMNRPQVRILAT